MKLGKLLFVACTSFPAFANVTTIVQGQPEKMPTPVAPAHFVSAVQLAINEPSPQLVQRSQRLVIQQFNNHINQWPALEGVPYDIRTTGNEVVFYMTTQSDMRETIQALVHAMVSDLNGRVHSRGRSLFYKAAAQDAAGDLEVVGDPRRAKIRSVTARAVPMLDVLREIKSRAKSVNLSYVIPGDCAKKHIDWSYGADAAFDAEGGAIDAVIGELASDFGMQLERQKNSYIFRGDCNEPAPRPSPAYHPELITTSFFYDGAANRPSHVFVPLMPIRE